MSIEDRELSHTLYSPEYMTSAQHNYADMHSNYLRENEGFSYVTPCELYSPVPGWLEENKEKTLRGGNLTIGAYHSSRASHPVGIYMPDNYHSGSGLPTIIMTTPLGTGVKGHNQLVAEQMMRTGFAVIVKGPPRYHFGQLKALSLTEDVNELLSLTREVSKSGIIGSIGNIFVYGESQAAMKGFGVIGLAKDYGLDVIDGLLAAPCYLHGANIFKPWQEIKRLMSMASSVIDFALQASDKDISHLQNTLSIKDLHHHIAVLPILASGETGKFLPFIRPHQNFSVVLFEKDGHSDPVSTKSEISNISPNIQVSIEPRYGHVDGIMSSEFADLRTSKLNNLFQKHYQHPAAS